MKAVRFILAGMLASAAMCGESANATTLTFDDLTGNYYANGALLPNMAFDGSNLTYSANGYIMSFAAGSGAHIGDATYETKTYNWHDGGANNLLSTVSLSRADGSAFDLASFDFRSDAGMTVTALGNIGLSLVAGTGTSTVGFSNVKSVTFFGAGDNRLDNIVVNAAAAVPEPATWAMMILGVGAVGFAMRRSRKPKVNTTVSFA